MIVTLLSSIIDLSGSKEGLGDPDSTKTLPKKSFQHPIEYLDPEHVKQIPESMIEDLELLPLVEKGEQIPRRRAVGGSKATGHVRRNAGPCLQSERGDVIEFWPLAARDRVKKHVITSYYATTWKQNQLKPSLLITPNT